MNNSHEYHQGSVEIQIFKEESIENENSKSVGQICIIEIQEEETGKNTSYFVDHEGQYYYQIHSSDSDNLNGEKIPVDSQQVYEDKIEILETVTNQLEPKICDVDDSIVIDENGKSYNAAKIAENCEGEKTEDGYGFTVYNSEEEIKDNKKPRRKRSSHNKDNLTYKCNYCNYITIRRYLLLRHMTCHRDARLYVCDVCEKGFKTSTALLNHVNMHNGVKPHTCKYCTSSFTTSGELIRHVRYRHTNERPHKCTECDYAAVELSKLRRHIRCHTGERPYQCQHCTYAAQDPFKLKRHVRTHTGEKPYACDNCNRRFTQSNSLKLHQRVHANDSKRFVCEFCPTKLTRKADLRTHIERMHSIQPVLCKLCGQILPSKYSYKVHNKSHKGEKMYKCKICAYSSVALRHLESHALIHTDEKPFECSKCTACFRQKQLLRRHENMYHNLNYVPKPPKEKLFKCPKCERKFAHQGYLNRHLEIRHSDTDSQYKKGSKTKKTILVSISCDSD